MPSIASHRMGHVRRARCALAGFAAALACAAGCYQPSFSDGLACSPDGRCPEGQSCASDGLCYGPGNEPVCTHRGSFEAELVPRDRGPSEVFGFSVAVDADLVVIGDPLDDTAAFDGGAAYVFRRMDGAPVEVQQLLAGDPSMGVFGHEVAAAGATVAVGSPFDVTVPVGEGSVYVYEFDGVGFAQSQKLTPPIPVSLYGSAIAMSESALAVAATVSDVVFVYERQGGLWQEVDQLAVAGLDLFAGALALDGDTLMVGGPGAQQDGNRGGTVFVFERLAEGWREVDRLTAGDAMPGAGFGWSVDIDDRFAVIGANFDDGAGLDAGAAYVFERSGGLWVEVDKLTARDSAVGDLLGESVAIEGDTIAVGAVGDDSTAGDSGAVYLFERRAVQWVQTDELGVPSAQPVAQFGIAVELADERLVVGASNSDGLGAGYAFEVICQ